MSDQLIIKVHPYNSEIHKRLMKEDPQYSEYVKNQTKQALFRRYHSDEAFRERNKEQKRERYNSNPEFRAKVLEKARLKRIELKEEKLRLKAESMASATTTVV